MVKEWKRIINNYRKSSITIEIIFSSSKDKFQIFIFSRKLCLLVNFEDAEYDFG